MIIQVHTLEKFKKGTKLDIVGTGNLKHDESDTEKDPSLNVALHGEPVNESEDFIAVVPFEDMTNQETETGVDLVKKVPELMNKGHRVTGTVIGSIDNETFFNMYLVEIDFIHQGANKERLEAMTDMEKLDFTIKGSMFQHHALMDVINNFLEGEEVIVNIETGATGEPIVVYPDKLEDHAGALLTAGEIDYQEDDKENLMKLLKRKKSLEGVVYGSEGKNYQIRVGVESDEYEAIITGKKIETMEDVFDNVHKNVGTPKETLNDIYVYLKSQGISKKQTKELFNMIRPYDESVVDFIPPKPKTAYHDNKGLLSRAITYILGGESVLMSGDAATGKNLMAETICWVVQKPYRFYSINIQTDKFDLTGRTVLQSQSEGGGTVVQDSFLIQMMKHGGAILLDEINASNPAIMTVLHSVVEKGHKMIDVESSDERVVAKEDFLLFGAMNPGYNGTNDLNEALHSRFATLNFGKNDNILGLLDVHHESMDAPIEMKERVNQLYGMLFENVQDGALSAKVLSFRRYAAAVKYAAEGAISLKDALIDNVANMVLDPFENEIILDAIDTQIG